MVKLMVQNNNSLCVEVFLRGNEYTQTQDNAFVCSEKQPENVTIMTLSYLKFMSECNSFDS